MDITANELTQWAKKNLEFIGYRLNRVNNIPFAKRKGTIQKGWADLQGYTENGIYVAVEIKKIGDKLSLEQKERFEEALVSIQDGKFTIPKLRETFELTDLQNKALMLL